MIPTFTIGDRVRIAHPQDATDRVLLQHTGSVVDLADDSYAIRVRLDAHPGIPILFHPHVLEPEAS